ncbi:MAG: hypothetical protein V4529_17100 [Gemmatimonadota bacterium]
MTWRDWITVTWQERIDDEWTVTYYGMRAGRDVVIAALEISPSSSALESWRTRVEAGQTVPLAGVTAQLLRGVKLGTARRLLGALKGLKETIHRSDPLETRKQPLAKTAPPNRNKLRQYLREDQELRLACDPNPAKTLATKHKVNRSTMRTWLRRAKHL